MGRKNPDNVLLNLHTQLAASAAEEDAALRQAMSEGLLARARDLERLQSRFKNPILAFLPVADSVHPSSPKPAITVGEALANLCGAELFRGANDYERLRESLMAPMAEAARRAMAQAARSLQRQQMAEANRLSQDFRRMRESLMAPMAEAARQAVARWQASNESLLGALKGFEQVIPKLQAPGTDLPSADWSMASLAASVVPRLRALEQPTFSCPIQGTPVNTLKEARSPTGDDTFRYSEDYRSIRTRHGFFVLTTAQAVAVEMLHSAWLNKTPELGQATILERIETPLNRLRDIFKSDAAWGKLVVRGTRKDTYRLNL